MKWLKEIIKVLLLYSLIMAFIVLIVLFPRNPDVDITGMAGTVNYSYSFSMEKYKENVTNFISYAIENKSLGGTKWRTLTVEDELAKFMPRSLKVLALGFILSLGIGLGKGIMDYMKSGSAKRKWRSRNPLFFQSIPDFFIMILIIWAIFFYIKPINIMGYIGWHKFLAPSIFIAISPMYYISRITSASFSSQHSEPHIQVAYSKGLDKKTVVLNHMLKPALLSIASHLPSLMVNLLSGLLVVEYLIGYEGAAYRLFSAIGYSIFISRASAEPLFESELIIGISLCFLGLVLFAHLLGKMLKLKFEPR